MEAFAPGVDVVEKDAFPVAQAPGSQFSAVLVRSKRGPDDRLTFCSGLDQFEKRYGKADNVHLYGWETARDYFEKGGIGLYVGRVIGDSAAASTLALAPIDASLATVSLNLAASSKGKWGDSAYVSTMKVQTLVNGAIAAPTDLVVVDSVAGFEIGDVVQIVDATAHKFVSILVGIDAGTKTLQFRNNTPAVIDDNAVVICASTHKVKTTLATAITTGSPTQISLASGALVDKGALLLVVSSNLSSKRVLEVTANDVVGDVVPCTVSYGDGSTTIPAGSVVVSVNFTLTATVDGLTVTSSELDLESGDAVNYAVASLAQTEYLRATAGNATVATFRAFIYPSGVTQGFLSGGANGSAPVDTDYLGTTVAKTYAHGVKLLDSVSVLPQFGIPASVTTVDKGADSYAQLRKDTIYVMAAPLTVDTLDELLTHRNVTLNIQSSYSALYAPWGRVAYVLTPGATLDVPPIGKILGVYSEVAQRRGVQKPPANEVVDGWLDVTANFTEAEFGLCNAAGVNLIRNVSGRGIRIMGARTLWPRADRKQFVSVRRILNATKIGFRDFGQELAQEANDDVLWQRIDMAGKRYLQDRWNAGWYFPRNDPTKAFLFQCDSKTNTESLRLAAKVRSIAGVNPVLPGELIRFEVFMLDGGQVNVNEI